MLTEEEAQNLMVKLIDLREKFKSDPSLKKELNKHEITCIQKFKYLVTMRTSRYKSFHNYDDLNQEGFEALVKAMKNYNPKKGSFFWWAHKYIDTRISRSANLHTTIRYPLKVAKDTVPHRETVIPLIVEERYIPGLDLEKSQIKSAIDSALNNLSNNQRQAVSMAFGLDGNKEMSVNKICKELNMTRQACIKLITNTLLKIKEEIKI